MAKVHAGSWFGLPDFGITEKVQSLFQPQKAYASSGGSNLFGPAPQQQASNIPSFKTQTPQTTVPAYQPTSGGGGTSYNIPQQATQSNNNQGYSQINAQQDAINQQIESDYNQAMGALDTQSAQLNSQAGTANSTIDTGAGDATNQINNTQATATNATNASLQQGETQAKTATQQARDVFRQTQQGNQAQLSALGISSSSVQEALAEKLGVETARRIAGVTDSLGTIRQNAVNELGRIKTYYQGQLQTLTQHVADQKKSIQDALMQGLQQINQARQTAASDKAAKRASLLSQVSSAIASLTQQQQQFQQSLDAWTAQKTAALQPIAQDPNYLNNLISTTNTLNKQFSPTGFQFTPQVNYDKYGNITGQISSHAPVKDQFGNPIQNTQNSGNGMASPDYQTYPHDGYTY